MFGVVVLELLQLPLTSAVQILDVHYVGFLYFSILFELVFYPGDEAGFGLSRAEELTIQRQHLLLEFTVARHGSVGAEPLIVKSSDRKIVHHLNMFIFPVLSGLNWSTDFAP